LPEVPTEPKRESAINHGVPMNVLSNQSLVYLVQLIDEELKRLKAEIADRDAEDPFLPDVEQNLLHCSQLATELQAMYDIAAKSTGNLPRYAQLVDN
jgi:hypothetical protein